MILTILLDQFLELCAMCLKEIKHALWQQAAAPNAQVHSTVFWRLLAQVAVVHESLQGLPALDYWTAGR